MCLTLDKGSGMSYELRLHTYAGTIVRVIRDRYLLHEIYPQSPVVQHSVRMLGLYSLPLAFLDRI